MKMLTTLISSALVFSAVQTKAEDNFHYDYATVIQSTPVYRIVEMTGQEQKCRTEEVVYRQARRNNGNSTLVGGILGAAVGHALGSRSKHRTGATIAGAFVGASLGGNNNNDNKITTNHENRCTMIPTSWEEERIIGYNVVYRYNDRTFETRLPFEPTESLKIRVMISPIADSSDRSE